MEQRERRREALMASVLVYSCVLVRFGGVFLTREQRTAWTGPITRPCPAILR